MKREEIIESIRLKFNMSEEDFAIFRKQLKSLIEKEIDRRVEAERTKLLEEVQNDSELEKEVEKLEKENELLKEELKKIVSRFEEVSREAEELRKENESLRYELEMQDILEEAKPYIRNERDRKLFEVLIEGVDDIDIIKKKVKEFIEIKKQEPVVIDENSTFKPKIDLKSKARERILSSGMSGGKFDWSDFTNSMVKILEELREDEPKNE